MSDEPRTPPPLWPTMTGRATWAPIEARFRRLVGLAPGHDSAPIVDPMGMGIEFSAKYFRFLFDEDRERARHAPRAVDTVREPFEIWLVPGLLLDGSVVMRRRYVSRYTGDEQAMVDQAPDGYAAWRAVGTSELDTFRRGYLLWP